MVKEYKESDLDTRSKKVLPVEVAQGLILLLVLSVVIMFGLAVMVLM